MNIIQILLQIYLTILQKLGLSNKSTSLWNPEIKRDVYKRKGHSLIDPTSEQIEAIKNSLLKKTRIEQWLVQDNTKFYDFYKHCSVKEDGVDPWPIRETKYIDTIIIGSTDDISINAEKLYNMDRGLDKILVRKEKYPGTIYHLFVNNSGIVEKISDYSNILPHTPGYHTRSLGIVLQYNVRGNDSLPPKKILSPLENLLTLLCLQFKLNPYKAIKGQKETWFRFIPFLKGERKIINTSPGELIDLDHLRWMTAVNMQRKLKYAELYKGPVNAKFNSATRTALNNFNSEAVELLYKESMVHIYE